MPAAAPVLSAAEVAPTSLPDTETARAAHAGLAARREALTEASLQRVNVDVPRALVKLLGAQQMSAPYRERLRGLAGGYDFALVEDLPRRIAALVHSWQGFLAATGDGDRVAALVAEAAPLRVELLRRWGPVLVAWDVVSQAELDGWLAGSGHADLGTDLVSVGETFEARWAEIEGKVRLTREQVRRAAELGRQLLEALGRREAKVSVDAARDDLRRSFTLVFEAYDELRRGLAFLRWDEGDLDRLAPSLFAQKGTARREEPGPVAPPVEPAPPAPPVG